jgi:hypothetical protein
MPSLTFGYEPSESIINNNGVYLNGTNPIHNIASGEIIGTLTFKYYSQKYWDANGDTKYFNTLVFNIILNDLQKLNPPQLNSLDATVYFESILPFERTPKGSQFEGKLTSTTMPVSPDAKFKYYVTQTGYRISEINF